MGIELSQEISAPPHPSKIHLCSYQSLKVLQSGISLSLPMGGGERGKVKWQMFHLIIKLAGVHFIEMLLHNG